MKVPIVSLGIVAGQLVASGVSSVIASPSAANILAVLDNFQSFYSGYDFTERNFNPKRWLLGYGPWIAKGAGSKIMSAVGSRKPSLPFISIS